MQEAQLTQLPIYFNIYYILHKTRLTGISQINSLDEAFNPAPEIHKENARLQIYYERVERALLRRHAKDPE